MKLVIILMLVAAVLIFVVSRSRQGKRGRARGWVNSDNGATGVDTSLYGTSSGSHTAGFSAKSGGGSHFDGGSHGSTNAPSDGGFSGGDGGGGGGD